MSKLREQIEELSSTIIERGGADVDVAAELAKALDHIKAADSVLVALGDALENEDSADDVLQAVDSALDALIKPNKFVARALTKAKKG